MDIEVTVLNHGVVIEHQPLVLMKSANQWKSEGRIICKTDELQIFGLWEHGLWWLVSWDSKLICMW